MGFPVFKQVLSKLILHLNIVINLTSYKYTGTCKQFGFHDDCALIPNAILMLDVRRFKNLKKR